MSPLNPMHKSTLNSLTTDSILISQESITVDLAPALPNVYYYTTSSLPDLSLSHIWKCHPDSALQTPQTPLIMQPQAQYHRKKSITEDETFQAGESNCNRILT
jgi:hypothetical protein